MQRTALFPGSFDPFTRGHAAVVEQALGIFDRVVIAIGHNIAKRGLLDIDARRRLIHLTGKGAEQQALFQQSFLDAEEAMVRGFSREEREALLSLLERVIQNLKEDCEE